MLRLATIDNFQGEEAKVIILSTVRSGDKLGFVKNPNRINVMMSRAREGLYVIGNSTTLETDSLWSRIINCFIQKNAISNAIRLQCDRHPSHYLDASCSEHFLSFPTCLIECNALLECGHSCKEICHEEALHSIIPCQQPCNMILPCGHSCGALCSEKCPPCMKKGLSPLRACGHTSYSTCSGESLLCEHFEGYIDLSCGRHAVGYNCGKPPLSLICDAICGQEMACRHSCEGSCGTCHATKSHAECFSTCDRRMNCDHLCDKPCHGQEKCPGCEQTREPVCQHSTQVSKCNTTFVPCIETTTINDVTSEVETLCCLATDDAACSFISPGTVEDLFNGIVQVIIEKSKDLKKEVEKSAASLDHTRVLFLLHSVSPAVYAADQNYQMVVRRTDDLIKMQRQASELNYKLELLSSGLELISQATKQSLPSVSVWVNHQIVAIELKALVIRRGDTVEVAKHLMNAIDQTQQMRKAGLEMLRSMRSELKKAYLRFGGIDSWVLEDDLKLCQTLFEKVNGLPNVSDDEGWGSKQIE